MMNAKKLPEENSDRKEPDADQIKELIYRDDLTGLYNRRYFRRSIQEFKDNADQTGLPLALVFADVDFFKQVNDSLGHSTGDAVLVRIAKILEQEVASTGKVFRYAGDEFLAVLPNISEAYVHQICESLLFSVQKALQNDPIPIRVTLSIGYALYPENTNNISKLMELADRALYFSKLQGRNRVSSSTEADLPYSEEKALPLRIQCSRFIGRTKEWDLLEEFFKDCREGRSRILLLAGEAGIGKSRLLKEFSRNKRAAEYHVFVGECVEATRVHPYSALRSAFQKGFEAKDTAAVNAYRSLNEANRRELLHLVPQFSRLEPKALNPSICLDKQVVFDSILQLLRRLSQQLPTVLMLEDLHWSDRATLSLLQHLARNLHDERILVAVTFREEEASGPLVPWFIKSMSRDKLFQTLRLSRFTAEESDHMISEIFQGFQIPDSFRKTVFIETEGNPFYIEELLKAMIQEGRIQKTADQKLQVTASDEVCVPYSVKALILRRMRGLDESLQRVLSLASIVGNEFELEIMRQLLEDNEGYLIEMLQHLVDLQLIREMPADSGERFAFNHLKIREVIYEEMGKIKRKRFHQRVAEILESSYQANPSYKEEIAYHFARAGNMEKSKHYFHLRES